MFKKKYPHWQIALLQAVGVLVYIFLLALVMSSLGDQFEPPGLVGIILVLTLLVLSAALTGSLVFGYSVYLAMQKKTKAAVQILGLTLLYLVGLLFVIFVLISIF
jgi:hypothetical protein